MRVVLDLRTETYRVLDDAGSALWSVLVGETNADDAFEALTRRYDVDDERLRGELTAFADRCIAEGLLERDIAPSGGDPATPPLTPPRAIRPRILRALLHLIGTQRALERDGFRTTYERYARLPLGPDDVALDAALSTFVRAENFFMMRAAPDDCLARSLALYRFLRSVNVAARHVIGICRFPFGAHAWVECGGAPVLEAALHGYTPLAHIGERPGHAAAAR